MSRGPVVADPMTGVVYWWNGRCPPIFARCPRDNSRNSEQSGNCAEGRIAILAGIESPLAMQKRILNIDSYRGVWPSFLLLPSPSVCTAASSTAVVVMSLLHICSSIDSRSRFGTCRDGAEGSESRVPNVPRKPRLRSRVGRAGSESSDRVGFRF